MAEPAPASAPASHAYGGHVHANGIRQHYLAMPGAGRPLVLVPGIASTAGMWAFVAARLAPAFDVKVLDVRGRGLSESSDRLDYSLDACADDLAAFLQALAIRDATVLGHSMGARIAVRMQRRHPGACAGLVLVDPPVSGPGRRRYPSPLPALLALLEAARRGEGEAALRAAGMPAWPEAHLLARAEWLHSCDPRAVEVAHRGFHEDDIHADLPTIHVPAALIAAGRGDVVRPEEADEILALAPGLLLRRLENAGHQMQVEDTEGFLRVLGEVLDALATAAPANGGAQP